MSSAKLDSYHVLVQFGDGVPVEHHGKVLFDLEGELRRLTGVRVEVFKEARGDDSRLRALMTTEQRAKL